MLDTPVMSVVVPSYRAGAYLVQLCESLSAQTFRDFEVLILCDGGDDHRQPGLELFRRDSRFRISSWSPNQGVCRATNRLLREVRAPFWCYPGADDLLHPEFLARRLKMARQLPEAAAIFGAGVQIDGEGAEIWYGPARTVTERLAAFDGRMIESGRMLRLLLQENVVNTPSIFCRSARTLPVLLEAMIDWRYAQDLHYWILIAAAGGGFAYDAHVLHSYRMHPRQLSSDLACESVRLAEMRLVPLVALSQAALISDTGLVCWREWRESLYEAWLLRALSLMRRGRLQWRWQMQAAKAYHGCEQSMAASVADFGWRLPRAWRGRRIEQWLAKRQVWTNGLRRVDDPIFRTSGN